VSKLVRNEEYVEFIEELKAIIVEGEFNSRWSLLETYHEVGKYISESHRDNYEQIAEDAGVSELTITRSVRFYEKFPDMNKLPEGKAISWHKVVNDYLPDAKRERKKKEKIITCPKCGHQWTKK
jgi:hypothetical protein